MTLSVHELYGDIWGEADAAFTAQLVQSLQPRSSDTLYDLFAKTGVKAGDSVLDVGCRDAVHAIPLAERYGCRVLGVDIIPKHIADAQARIAAAGLTEQIRVQVAGIEALPLQAGEIDHIWCRDMLNHVDLTQGLRECSRVLARGGRMLVYQTFATDWLEPKEAQRLFASMSIVPTNMNPAYFETTATAAGFTVLARDPIDSEWREQWLEAGKNWATEDLLALARMRRREAELVAQFGRNQYEANYGSCLWGVYQMLGKLCPTVYLLGRR